MYPLVGRGKNFAWRYLCFVSSGRYLKEFTYKVKNACLVECTLQSSQHGNAASNGKQTHPLKETTLTTGLVHCKNFPRIPRARAFVLSSHSPSLLKKKQHHFSITFLNLLVTRIKNGSHLIILNNVGRNLSDINSSTPEQ